MALRQKKKYKVTFAIQREKQQAVETWEVEAYNADMAKFAVVDAVKEKYGTRALKAKARLVRD